MRRLLSAFCLLLATLGAHADDWVQRRQVQASFEQVKEALVLAIENRGLVINYTSHIADMLDRTGADLGTTRRIYERAEIIEFCSARLSRQMMEADPHNIVLCPFAISIYALPGQSGKTWIAYRLPQGPAATLVGPLLRDITAEAAE